MEDLYLILGGFFILLPLIAIAVIPYAGGHEFFSIFTRISVGIPIVFVFGHILRPTFDQFSETALIWSGLAVLGLFSCILTLSLWSPPQYRFYPRGTVKLYDAVTSNRYKKKSYIDERETDKREGFTIELHAGDRKWVRTFRSEKELLGSINPKEDSCCWYCGSAEMVYLEGITADQYTGSSIHRTGPMIGHGTKTKYLCEDCTSMLIEKLNENSEKSISQSDLVAAQI